MISIQDNSVDLAIIGTAGRKDDADKITPELWAEMKRTVYRFVKEHDVKTVISGGAAVADHLAVGLFNAGLVNGLTLALPCGFDWFNEKYVDNGQFNWQTNPGGTANFLHKEFSRKVKINSLGQIKTAYYSDSSVIVGHGFHDRNSTVADAAKIVLAFTFGQGRLIKDGGTANTCRTYLNRGKTELFHACLQANSNKIEIFPNAVVK